MNSLITGGAGFIGSHLAEALLKKGDKVVVVDDLSTGSVKNISGFRKNPGFKFIKGTIADRSLMAKLIRRCDMIYHLAAAVGVKYIIDNPLKSIRTNVGGTEVILELADKYGGKKVLLASTSEIYGKDRPGKRVFRENDDRVLGPTTVSRWSYSCSKALDEFLALAFQIEKGLPVVIVRFFNTCGPRQTGRYGMVVPRFICQALANKPITIYGSGTQTRCFTDVEDAVHAVVMLGSNKKAIGEVFNIGNPDNRISISSLAARAKRITGSKSDIVYLPYEKVFRNGFEDMKHREPDITKLKNFTGFVPEIGIDGMLSRIIDYVKRNRITL